MEVSAERVRELEEKNEELESELASVRDDKEDLEGKLEEALHDKRNPENWSCSISSCGRALEDFEHNRLRAKVDLGGVTCELDVPVCPLHYSFA